MCRILEIIALSENVFVNYQFFYYFSKLSIHFIEAKKQEQINNAEGEAKALFAVAEARAESIEIVANALRSQVLMYLSVCVACPFIKITFENLFIW